MSFNARGFRKVQILLVVWNFFVFLPEGTDDSDRVECLFRIACTLWISYRICNESSLHHDCHDSWGDYQRREACKQDEWKRPATREGKREAREAHAEREEDCSSLFSKTFLYRIHFFGNFSSQFLWIVHIEPGYVLLKDPFQVSNLYFACYS